MNITVTQRSVHLADRGEYRDCLDRRMTAFLEACGLMCVPMPTATADVSGWLAAAHIGGVLISGGNDLEFLGGGDISPERDAFEHALLDTAPGKGLPVFGVCRGLQIMAHHYGADLVPVSGHAACRHPVSGGLHRPSGVNSYHNYGVLEKRLPETLQILSLDSDGGVEALRVSGLAQMAVMWHPEREAPFDQADIDLVRTFFRSGGSLVTG